MLLLGGFAGVALLLAAIGLYGVIAYAVAQRQTKESSIAAEYKFTSRDLREMFSKPEVRRTLGLLVGAIAFVLFIAAANVANLQLARTETRQQELAVRAALGAGRGPVFRQLLTENLLLAAIGLYGVLTYSVARRTREIGIRRALGARMADVLHLILGQGLMLVATGALIGIGIALATGRVLRAYLFGVRSADPVTFVSVAVLLAAVGLVACWLPARRAARVDPMEALRCE